MLFLFFFFFQAEDGIRDFCLSRGLGDVYKRQVLAKAILNGIILPRMAQADCFPAGRHPARLPSKNFSKSWKASIRRRSPLRLWMNRRWLSLIHISEPTRQAEISYAVFCLKKKKKSKQKQKRKKNKKKQNISSDVVGNYTYIPAHVT